MVLSHGPNFFSIPSGTPIATSDLDLHLCLLKQVGKDVTFSSRTDGSKIVTVHSEAQAVAMASLVDPSGSAVPATRDPYLNSCQGTILVPSTICLGDHPWDECSTLIKSILTY